MSNFECVVTTHGDRGTPHMESLVQSNPNLFVSVDTAEGPPSYKAWSSYDERIRNWAISRKVLPERVLFIEYDVLVTTDLSTVFKEVFSGVECAGHCKSIIDEEVLFFIKDVFKLDEPDRKIASSIQPLAVLMLDRESLKAIADPAHDDYYRKDIFSEVRFATCLKKSGVAIRVNPRLSGVRTHLPPKDTTLPGIYHPVK